MNQSPVDNGICALKKLTSWSHSGSEPFATYALRDIKKGEEVVVVNFWFPLTLDFQLREDYATYEYPAWFLALCKDFGLDFSYVKMYMDNMKYGILSVAA